MPHPEAIQLKITFSPHWHGAPSMLRHRWVTGEMGMKQFALNIVFKSLAGLYFVAIPLLLPAQANASAGMRIREWPSTQLIQEQIRSTPSPRSECHRDDMAGAYYLWNQNGEFLPQCAPEILYSWRSLTWLTSLQNRHDNQNAHHHWPRIPDEAFVERYFWMTPLGTFGYGQGVLRVKLRPHIHFRAIERSQRHCSLFSEEEKRTTVFMAVSRPPDTDAYFTEFITCSEEVVESWSIDSSVAYEEALREFTWIIRNPISTWDAYIPWQNLSNRTDLFPWFSILEAMAHLGGSIDPNSSLFPLVGDHARERWTYNSLRRLLTSVENRTHHFQDPDFVRSQSRKTDLSLEQSHNHTHRLSYFYQSSISEGDRRFLNALPLPDIQNLEIGHLETRF